VRRPGRAGLLSGATCLCACCSAAVLQRQRRQKCLQGVCPSRLPKQLDAPAPETAAVVVRLPLCHNPGVAHALLAPGGPAPHASARLP
jgi:hypothetical protein